MTPPLRGPDEAAHFLRGIGIARGEWIPRQSDEHGRKGLFLPESIRPGFAEHERRFGRERRAFGRPLEQEAAGAGAPQPAFVLYEGSEGYAPIGYLPYAAAALAAMALDLDFRDTLYAMRIAGLLASTALIGFSIAILPGTLRWLFLAIAMMPSALFARAMITPDALSIASAMVVAALMVRSAEGSGKAVPLAESCWLAVAALTKPANIVLALWPVMERISAGRKLAIAGPAVLLVVLWSVATGADAGSWRLTELTGIPAEEFQLIPKLRFMIADPLAFPTMALGTVVSSGLELWKQLIGVLGLFDAPLRSWFYVVLSVALVAMFPLAGISSPSNRAARIRLALSTGTLAAAYCILVFFIMFVIWTPSHADQVWGVQGRYFVPALPLVAITIAILRGGVGSSLLRPLALFFALMSGIASFDAMLQSIWAKG